MAKVDEYAFTDTKGRNIPKPNRTFFHDTETDEMYIPGDPIDLIKAAADGIKVISEYGLRYFPFSWMKREYPKKDFGDIETKMRAATKAEKED
jgi:hypothetical protein